jgi:hypothetical protein
MRVLFKRALLSIAVALISTLAFGQVTTSEIEGRVSDKNGILVGATIQAIHIPSGTMYGSVTNQQGRFLIQGMRTGGPYKVTVSFVGYQSNVYDDINLKLGEPLSLNVSLSNTDVTINEVVVSSTRSKFVREKTGAVTNISNNQLASLPTINRSLSDFTRLSPYAGANNSIGGRDGRSNTFTIDGANLNNNFGLSSNLPGGGNPISLDAIEEVQVVVAPFDVRQTNFVGGGVNAITKSGTNTFKGSAYGYWRNENLRGNKVDGYDLGDRQKESKETYGFTLGGPLVKNKFFFFINGEYENQPQPITKWRASENGVANSDAFLSRASVKDMQEFSDILKTKYGYDAGSFTDYNGGTTNKKFLARLDWNISNNHKLSVRYNLTKNSQDVATNGTSTVGAKATSNRISDKSMAFKNDCYIQGDNVMSVTGELNSSFGSAIKNRLLVTYSKNDNNRSSNSSPFPQIDIWNGGDAYMSAGYELFTWKNKVENKTFNVQDNVTWTLGNHRIIGGFSYENQMALNNYMRYGTGYYKYASFDAFKNNLAPIAFGLTYGYNGETEPAAEVKFAQSGVYLQDEWNVTKSLKVTYGVRAELLTFLNDLETNEAFKALSWKDHFIAKTDPNYATYSAPIIDNGKWPKNSVLLSPRVGFNWKVFEDNSLVVRGGTGIFTGRIPMVFFTNMPTNGMMLQNTVQITDAATLSKLAGGVITDVNQMINTLGLPTTSTYSNANAKLSGASIVGVADDFKLPQVWKSSVAVDYQAPTSFPLSFTVEGMYNKDINAITQENWNVINEGNLTRFAGPDSRYNYRSVASSNVVSSVTGGAVVLSNTKKGYSGSFNFMANAQPVKDLYLMASYIRMYAKEVSGLPGSQAYSSWQNLYSVDSPNLSGLQYSQYLTPHKVIASANYKIEYGKGRNFCTSIGMFYTGYYEGSYTYYYGNDMNGDGQNTDLIYIPKTKDEIAFVDKNGFTAAQQVDAFWNFINQDDYLKDRKGKYTEAYGARMPWLNRIDLKVAQDFKIKIGGQMNTLQFSVDILNAANLLNDSWGVTHTTASANYGKILNYEGVVNNTPRYSMAYVTDANKNKNLISKTFDTYKSSSNCWMLQFGIRYIFN